MKSYDITFGKPESLEGLTYYEVKFKHQPRIEDVEGMLRSYAPNIYEYRSVLIGLANHSIGLFTNEVAVFRGNFSNPMTGQIMSDVCVIDNLIKPAVHEMTIEEIEKEL